MESITKILRRILDERGIKWVDAGDSSTLIPIQHATHVAWDVTVWPSIEYGDYLWVQNRHPLTPEQAIAATVGAHSRDIDATRKRRNVADPLRDFAQSPELVPGMSLRRCRDYLLWLADEIDREHARRMRQQSYDLRRAFCRYFGGIIDDYRHGIKRKRLRK